jgi:hypothetical protein
VCEASPSKKRATSDLCPKSALSFFSNLFTIRGLREQRSRRFFETTAPACTSGNSQSFMSAQIQAILLQRLVQ